MEETAIGENLLVWVWTRATEAHLWITSITPGDKTEYGFVPDTHFLIQEEGPAALTAAAAAKVQIFLRGMQCIMGNENGLHSDAEVYQTVADII